MKIFTIGFTKTSAESFFGRLEKAPVERLIDVRLNNVSQLAGFAKRDDLQYFLRRICEIDYLHRKDLAPTKEMLDSYRKGEIDWSEYEERFLALMTQRKIENKLNRDLVSNSCLLCSEEKAHQCHRRLVAEYIRRAWGDVEVIHL